MPGPFLLVLAVCLAIVLPALAYPGPVLIHAQPTLQLLRAHQPRPIISMREVSRQASQGTPTRRQSCLGNVLSCRRAWHSPSR